MLRFGIFNVVHVMVIVGSACVIGSMAGYDEITTLLVTISSGLLGIGSYVGGVFDERLRVRK